MTHVEQLDSKLNGMILRGEGMEAFEKFYDDDIVMHEPNRAPREGKALNREFEQEFFDSIDQVNDIKLRASSCSEDVSFGEWLYDVTMKDGSRMQFEEASRRTWRDGKVVDERFYYERHPAGTRASL